MLARKIATATRKQDFLLAVLRWCGGVLRLNLV